MRRRSIIGIKIIINILMMMIIATERTDTNSH